MDVKSAFSAAAALVLVVAGGATALSAAQSVPGGSSSNVESTVMTPLPTTVIVEYVDEFGNPVAAPGTAPVEVRTFSADGGVIEVTAAAPEIVWIDAPSSSGTQASSAAPSATGGEYEDHEDEDHEYEDHEDEDHEDEDHEDRSDD